MGFTSANAVRGRCMNEEISDEPGPRPLSNQVISAIRQPLKIASYAIPLWVVQRGIEALAGEETVIDFNIRVALVFSVAVSAAAAGLWRKTARQRKRLEKQRREISELEEEVSRKDARVAELEGELQGLRDNTLNIGDAEKSQLEPHSVAND